MTQELTKVTHPENHLNTGEASSDLSDLVDPGYQLRANKQRANLERMRLLREAKVASTRERVVKQAADYEKRTGRKPDQSIFEASVKSAEHALETTEKMLEFIRPPSDKDVDNRLKALKELPSLVAEAAPRDIPLRFHGSPIYTSRDIIASKGISSSVDRIGSATSYDVSDQVSVTMPDTLRTTVDSYTGLTECDCCMPAGCIFVMLPKSSREAEAGTSMLMGNVDFEEHPEQLFAIMTSEENLDTVRGWVADAGLDTTKVVEFFDFTDGLGDLRDAIEQGDVDPQDIVPYELTEK